MALNIRSLFTTKTSNDTGIPNSLNSSDNILKGETYTNYGIRICGRVTANLPALAPFLSKVYHGEKQRQIEDQQIQTQKRNKIQNDISRIDNEITQELNKKNEAQTQIDNLNKTRSELKGELAVAKAKNGEVNKMARMKLIIGCIILLIMTAYLFIFYSSTFYSAFFKEFDTEMTIGIAMFDSSAIPNAVEDGLGELLFICTAPIIFMGLGYCMHFFMQSKSKIRYLKAGSILIITFIFDCILAYLIGKKIYDIEALTTTDEFPPFSMKIAATDPNFWAVIFCGFIVYFIWGIVFDMAMTAYENLRSNKGEIDSINAKIGGIDKTILNTKQTISNIDNNITALKGGKSTLEKSLDQNVFFDTQIIQTSMTDFFTGWMSIMSALNRPEEDQIKANSIFNQTIAQFFNN